MCIRDSNLSNGNVSAQSQQNAAAPAASS